MIKIIDKSSNFSLAIAFKTTETKIKSTKLNMALKYQQIEGDPIAVFLSKINDKLIKLGEEGKNYTFFIEDQIITSNILENKIAMMLKP